MQTIYLDISNKGVYPCIYAKQSEVGRKFLAVITDNGVPYNIPSDSLLSVWYEGDTDAGNYSSINEESAFSIDGNKVTVELVAQMLLQPGNGELCLSVTHGDGGETNTWNIPYCVEYKPGAGSSVPTEYYTALTEAGAEAAKHATSARNDAEIAASYGRNFLLTIYPVGSVYISTLSTDPSTLFGGVWRREKDRFLLAAGDTYAAGSVGGSSTHKISIDEMPNHQHNLVPDVVTESGEESVTGGYRAILPANNLVAPETTIKTSAIYAGLSSSTGGSKPMEIMPPYFTVYVWIRVE